MTASARQEREPPGGGSPLAELPKAASIDVIFQLQSGQCSDGPKTLGRDSGSVALSGKPAVGEEPKTA
jgi:hypothetical protein